MNYNKKKLINLKKDSNETELANQNENDFYSKFDVLPFVGKEAKHENISKIQKQKYEKNYLGKKQLLNLSKTPEGSKVENVKKVKKEEINPNFYLPEEAIKKINKE